MVTNLVHLNKYVVITNHVDREWPLEFEFNLFETKNDIKMLGF